ncbi:hypothetical protein [Frankia tisae]|uniref:hypothetical protein n=1 Tax=Frankia tisae TaxID=2950104 RepID=UPI0021C09619|nr:hypothetical protein [Frankia tisae]
MSSCGQVYLSRAADQGERLAGSSLGTAATGAALLNYPGSSPWSAAQIDANPQDRLLI